MSLAGCQINPIDVNFFLQKSLEIFEENSADKIWSKKDNECKVSQLMPIKVKDAASLKLWDGMYLKLSAVTEMPE